MEKTYFIETFGCQMNLHDSEKIAGTLREMGYLPAKIRDEAGIIVFNTCCIRDTAEQKIYGNIGELKALKRADKSKIIVILGCMTQQTGAAEKLAAKFPFVDIIMGTGGKEHLKERLEELAARRERKKGKICDVPPCELPPIDENGIVCRTSFPNAWVNIMYGCNNFCTYCIVPHVRGRERSRDPEAILNEIKALLTDGYKEITLLGQNVNSYGADRADGTDFAALLTKIAQIPGKFRLRFMTSHPKDLWESVIKAIADCPNFCNNIHLPVQSGSNKVLADMNRRYSREKYFALIDLIRRYMPDCGITSDIMTGFPTETEEDFEDTLDLVRRVRFENAFTFVYSPRTGTPAAAMPQLSEEIKKDRIMRLVALQNEISREIAEGYVGSVKEVLAEDAPSEGRLVGRTESGRLVNFAGGAELVGEFLQIRIDKARASALYGEII